MDRSAASKWYSQYFQAIQKAGISLSVTLYHWELPLFLHQQGGWANRETADWLTRHARAVVSELGEFIDEYFILNEPWCSSLLSYHLGIHAPGHMRLSEGLSAAHHLLLGQGMAFREMKSIDSSLRIGTVYNVEPTYAASSLPADIQAARYADGYLNRWFFDPTFLGKYPEDMCSLYQDMLPDFPVEDLEVIRIGDQLDVLGVNYYLGRLFEFDEDIDIRSKSVILPEGETNDLGWPVCVPPTYPSGLYDILQQLHHSYPGMPSIYISENGIALKTPWDKKAECIPDERRIKYLQAHLEQIDLAIRRGVRVERYYAWTLLDNYEWAEGYRPESCFGLIHVDRDSLQRVKKQSYEWYAELIKNHKDGKSLF